MIDAGLWLAGMRSIVHGRPPRDEIHDLSDLPYGQLGVPQNATERVLARHLERCGVAVERGAAFAGLTQEDGEAAVDLDHAAGRRERAHFRYVVGCDGAHSAVRHALAIPFEGEAYPMMFMLGDVQIGWDLPRGMALRALRLVEDGPPAMFIAIPLPEPGRYRVSMLAPPTAAPRHGHEHGIQAELQGPQLGEIQAVADDLLPAPARVSDLRWSSLFRISMRLASHYRGGHAFIAGDAAHIHPPTGGQGMNTGIQDAYNLAWKLALVLQGAAPEELLDSYEAERRPVGAEVVARTRAASEAYGREQPERSDRLADTQIGVSYRGSPWVGEDGAGLPGSAPAAGDRAPDAGGLRRRGVGFPSRLFDILRGPEHVLLAYCRDRPRIDGLAGLVQPPRLAERLRIVVVVAPGIAADEPPGAALYRDAEGAFAAAYGGEEASFLVRPDGHIGWRGRSSSERGLSAYLDRALAVARTTGI
jgi:2-polyprenyl-6-methoxyphenol hydroxylase-like FAD-dependent oxidoreductase